jgi:hypothetical protein
MSRFDEEWLMSVIDDLPVGPWLDDAAVERSLLEHEQRVHGATYDSVWTAYWRPRLISFGVSARKLVFSGNYELVRRVS